MKNNVDVDLQKSPNFRRLSLKIKVARIASALMADDSENLIWFAYIM